MAIGDNLSFSVDANSFKSFSLGKATSSEPSNLWNKDNLEVRKMAQKIYHFSQSEVDIVPRLLPQGEDISNADIHIYDRIGKAQWVAKKVAGVATPYQDKETDRRGVVPTILHTATVEDIDYHRKNGMRVTAAYQVEQMNALSRAKEVLSQFGATQSVIKLASTLVAGYTFTATGSNIALPDAQKRVIVDDPSLADQTKLKVGGVHRGGTNQATLDWFDDVDSIIEEALQRSNDYVIIGDYSLRRQLRKIAAFRDLESTVAFQGNEFASIFRYKNLLFVFLLKDAYYNQKVMFHNKHFDEDGKIVASGKTDLGAIAADTTTYKTLLLINVTGSEWSLDSGAIYSAVDELPGNSFAKVQYMKAGYAYCRKDEGKVFLVLYDASK